MHQKLNLHVEMVEYDWSQVRQESRSLPLPYLFSHARRPHQSAKQVGTNPTVDGMWALLKPLLHASRPTVGAVR